MDCHDETKTTLVQVAHRFGRVLRLLQALKAEHVLVTENPEHGPVTDDLEELALFALLENDMEAKHSVETVSRLASTVALKTIPEWRIKLQRSTAVLQRRRKGPYHQQLCGASLRAVNRPSGLPFLGSKEYPCRYTLDFFMCVNFNTT